MMKHHKPIKESQVKPHDESLEKNNKAHKEAHNAVLHNEPPHKSPRKSAAKPAPKSVRIGILTCSDRASQGIYDDASGKSIMETLAQYLITPYEFVYAIIPDDQAGIETTLKHLADEEHCSLIITTGGTGPAVRDVTPEATEAVCEKMMPGFGEEMRRISLRYVPTAILSRQTAGVRGRTLIINLPGKPKSIRECLEAVFPAVPYCLDLIGAARIDTDESVIKAFRPKA
jgi:molybdopterin adenylyltransferase